MFCQKCGKEIVEEAVVCPYCGCATANYVAAAVQPRASKQHSAQYTQVLEFSGQVKKAYTFAIIALATCLGIGAVFAFPNVSRIKKLKDHPDIPVTDPDEIRVYEAAKSKLKKAYIMNAIGGYINAMLWFFVLFLCFSYSQR